MSITLRRRLRPYRAQSTDGKESSHGNADTGHQAVLRSLQKDLFGRRVQRFRSVASALVSSTSPPGLLLLPRLLLQARARGAAPARSTIRYCLGRPRPTESHLAVLSQAVFCAMIRQSAKPSVTENWAPQRNAWIARVSTCRSTEGRFDQIPGLLRFTCLTFDQPYLQSSST
jgi:hypothetical protein